MWDDAETFARCTRARTCRGEASRTDERRRVPTAPNNESTSKDISVFKL